MPADNGNNELLAALLSSISEGVVVCDKDGVLQSFNRAAREFHGEDLDKGEAEFINEIRDVHYSHRGEHGPD